MNVKNDEIVLNLARHMRRAKAKNLWNDPSDTGRYLII